MTDNEFSEVRFEEQLRAALHHLQVAERELMDAIEHAPDDDLEPVHRLAEWGAGTSRLVWEIMEYLEPPVAKPTQEQELIAAAALAVELFNEDDLERYAQELQRVEQFDEELVATS